MSALVGIAIDKGYIQGADQPITDFLPDRTFANMIAWKNHYRAELIVQCLTVK